MLLVIALEVDGQDKATAMILEMKARGARVIDAALWDNPASIPPDSKTANPPVNANS